MQHRAHPPWTHQIQQLHHPVPSISRSPIPFWHPHLQFDVPAFFGWMFCIEFLLRSTDTEIQSYPSVTRDFQSITSCLCNRWSSLICFDELPCSEPPPSIMPLQYSRPYTCTIDDCDVTVFFVGGRRLFASVRLYVGHASVIISFITERTCHVPFWSCMPHRDRVTGPFIIKSCLRNILFVWLLQNDDKKTV